MAQKRRFSAPKKKHHSRGPAREATPREPLVLREPPPPVEYGKPFVLLEDADKTTYHYLNGAWVPYSLSIAQCREACQVKVLPQKVNSRTRYEVRLPLGTDA